MHITDNAWKKKKNCPNINKKLKKSKQSLQYSMTARKNSQTKKKP